MTTLFDGFTFNLVLTGRGAGCILHGEIYFKVMQFLFTVC